MKITEKRKILNRILPEAICLDSKILCGQRGKDLSCKCDHCRNQIRPAGLSIDRKTDLAMMIGLGDYL